MQKTIATSLGLAVIVAALLGYEARALNGVLPTRIKTVAIVVIPGNAEASFARVLERTLEDEFVAEGTLDIAEEDVADSKLMLKIVSYNKQPVKYDVEAIVNEYNLALTLEGTFTDLATNQVLAQVLNIYESVSYAAVGAGAETEYQAFERLAEKIAPLIVKGTILRR
ncbi:MAG: hypothetical protein JSU81_04475 [Candidatus Coatesbacteria bacterium]|nr:MAG: hypothetical protein JSU81_04475 [Candidatus Coatesbacteria bacterium]